PSCSRPRASATRRLRRPSPARRSPALAGSHLAAWFTGKVDAPRLLAACADADVGVELLGRYAMKRRKRDGLAFGYGICPDERIEEAVIRIARVHDSACR